MLAHSIEHDSGVLGVARSAGGARWIWRCDDARSVLTLSQKLGISDALARILAGRGIDHASAADFLDPSLRAALPEPCHLLGMEEGAARLADAVTRGETVGIFGDYDVDGATSTALLLRYFRSLDVPVRWHIPDRIAEGYGPNTPALLKLQAEGASLILTVDCGTLSHAPLAEARKAGIDIVVIDHHMASAELPEAVAVINPNRLDQQSECRHLAAVGVVFLTLVALNRELRRRGYFATRPEPDLRRWLDLVALGTVCDVMALTGLNRAFVRQGLTVLAQRRNPGLNALLAQGRVEEVLSGYHLGFILGPRINAGGRVGEATLGVRLLTTDDPAEAAAIAARLEAYNAERQAIEQVVLDQASAMAETQTNRAVILVTGEGWHPGVIGIVAGRLKERYQRPVAVIALSGDTGKASARSVPGADFGEAVAGARTAGLLVTGGGHAMAAGFTVERDRIDALHDYLEARMGEASAWHRAERLLRIDACLAPGALDLALADELARGAPYGNANSHPRLALGHCRVLSVDCLKERHVKLHLACEPGRGRLGAIAFRAVGTPLGDFLLAQRGRQIHLAGQLRKDYWQGEARISFHIDDAHGI